jgi:hypothetical protein
MLDACLRCDRLRARSIVSIEWRLADVSITCAAQSKRKHALAATPKRARFNGCAKSAGIRCKYVHDCVWLCMNGSNEKSSLASTRHAQSQRHAQTQYVSDASIQVGTPLYKHQWAGERTCDASMLVCEPRHT